MLRLVAAGQTDRQIAAALVLGEGTAGRPPANIFDPVGVSARAAPAFAQGEGLA
jgi:DNA-binding NarL/FixJ family response regulator